jgi:hypothetical protein
MSSETDTEAARRQKMTALKDAREAHREWAKRGSRQLMGSLYDGRLKMLKEAIRTAEADLRQFNELHPRERP